MSPNLIDAPVRAMLVLGTRPEAIKLAPVARAMAASELFEPIVVTTGQHREMLHQMLDLLQVRERTELDVMRERQELSTLTARLVDGLGEIIRAQRPDLVIVQGDTTTALTGALAAFYEHVPVAHVEAGLRTGVLDNPFPEELNRRLIGRVARWHFAPTPRAGRAPGGRGRARLRGLHHRQHRHRQPAVGPGRGHRAQPLHHLRPAARAADPAPPGEPGRHHARHGPGAVRRLADRGDVEILLPLHKSPAVRDALLPELTGHPRVRVVEPLGYLDFSATLAACDVVLTDSGGVQEEAPSLGKPALVLRTTTERPEAVEAGAARLVGTVPDVILAAVERLLDDRAEYDRMASAGNPFGDGRATERIIAQLAEDFGADADTGPVEARLPEGPGSYSTA
ncbi:UDP-N-acetylglucosamine 2-epimerase (non-hydrolyzing) [Streptomyces thioluteus]|uniref:UDP-N-acetylglucosamine 2-epimerase (non-hydrolyzing) n=1 Tax=Streptomyces thioluteus TaxID=66431 RepID=A0ABP6J4Y9_STRTU